MQIDPPVTPPDEPPRPDLPTATQAPLEFVVTTSPPVWVGDPRRLPRLPDRVVAEEYRLIPELRGRAAWRNPTLVLAHSAVEYLQAERATGSTRDALAKMATAIADLAVTGRHSYGQFRNGISLLKLEGLVRERLDALQLPSPASDAEIKGATDRALDRAYAVAWALRGPLADRSRLREALGGWVAVSAEDDMPHRPVNMPAPPFEQFEVQVRTPGGGGEIALATRFIVASADPIPGAGAPVPSPSARQVPPDPVPVVPSDHLVVLFLHGHGSGAEEADELIPHLLEQGRQLGRKYAVISFDLPNYGYSETFDHRRIAPSEATTFPFWPHDNSTPIATPVLDFIEDFVVAFVDALEEAAIRNGTPRIKHRIASVIGGSLGGNLCLRLGRRRPRPSWLRNVVAWSPASVWKAKARHDPGREGSRVSRDRFLHEQVELPSYRNDYFHRVYSEWSVFVGPQPQYWYGKSFARASAYIDYSRSARWEVYSPIYRLWHWRVACEQLIYSHAENEVYGDNSTPVRYMLNTVRTLLAAGEEDDADHVKIYSATAKVAEAMTRTPGRLLLLRKTGHSIHTERTQFFASQIAAFPTEDSPPVHDVTGPHFLWYSALTGAAAIDRVRPDQQGTYSIWSGTWRLGWTHFMPFELAGKAHYLSYKAADGVVTIDRVRDDGQGSDTIWSGTWRPGWSDFMPFELDGQAHYLSHMGATGAVAIDRVKSDGQGSETIWSGTWGPGWSHFMPFEFAGQAHYLSYKAGTGAAAIDRVKPDGRGSDTVWSGNWSPGWTHFMPFELAGQAHYLSYMGATGAAAIDRVRPDGRGSDTIWSGRWGPGWSHFMPFELAGQAHYLSYQASTGAVAIDRFRPDGQGSDTIWNDTWTPDWIHFMPFTLV